MLLDRLHAVEEATYDPEHVCLEGTRSKFLNSLLAKLKDKSSSNTVWVYGVAGSGKSTISTSVALNLNKEGFLGGCLVRSRSRQGDQRVHEVERVHGFGAVGETYFCDTETNASVRASYGNDFVLERDLEVEVWRRQGREDWRALLVVVSHGAVAVDGGRSSVF